MDDSGYAREVAGASKVKKEKRGQNSAEKLAWPFSGFAVLVSFQLKPGKREEFEPLVLANARASLEREPGCLQFDVVFPDGTEDRIVLYEVYTSREAFTQHSTMPHYTAFSENSADLVREKSVMAGIRLNGPIPS